VDTTWRVIEDASQSSCVPSFPSPQASGELTQEPTELDSDESCSRILLSVSHDFDVNNKQGMCIAVERLASRVDAYFCNFLSCENASRLNLKTNAYKHYYFFLRSRFSLQLNNC